MKKTYFVLLVLLGLSVQSSCSFHAILTPPYKTYEIPLSGKARIIESTKDGIFLGSYNIDQHKKIVEKNIDILKINFNNHSQKFEYQIQNSRINFNQFIYEKIPFIYSEEFPPVFFWQRLKHFEFSVIRKKSEKEEIIFNRKNISNNHCILFVIIDSKKNNKPLKWFSSFDHFDSQTFEIFQYDIHTEKTVQVAKGAGRLYSNPYYETKNFLYLEVRDIGQPRKIFCIRKSDFTLEKITPIDRQYLVGSDYNTDLLLAYNHKTFELTLWKGSAIQQVIPCSSYPYEVDSVTLKVHQNNFYLVAVIEDGFDSDKRFLRWIKFDPKTKEMIEKNWNQNLKYKLERHGYESNKNDYYILGYERSTRQVVLGEANLIKGTIHYRETDHKIPKDIEFESSHFINDSYCLWFEGTPFSDVSITGEKQNYNPTGYYCSLEEPFLQKLKKKD